MITNFAIETSVQESSNYQYKLFRCYRGIRN